VQDRARQRSDLAALRSRPFAGKGDRSRRARSLSFRCWPLRTQRSHTPGLRVLASTFRFRRPNLDVRRVTGTLTPLSNHPPRDGGPLTSRDAIYERTKDGWNAYLPDVDATAVGQKTLEDAEQKLRNHDLVRQLLETGDPHLRSVVRPFRISTFTNTFDWLGPVVVLLSSWYFSVQVLVAWTFRPPYNLFNNAISDLGATRCYQAGYAFCSPRWLWMDFSIGILGAAMMLGSMLIFTEFRFSRDKHERVVAAMGFVLLAISGFGALLVACVPENLNGSEWHLHTVGTAVAIAAGQLGILILGFVLRSIPDWLREFMIVTSLIVLLGGIAYAFYKGSSHPLGFGPGALERLIQYPQALWLILFGFYISRDHWRKGVTGRRFRLQGQDRPQSKGAFRWALGATVRGNFD
jgi:hypothetical membrane protein